MPAIASARASQNAGSRARPNALDVRSVQTRWSNWWGDGLMEVLVPNVQRRHEVERELPQVPLTFYDEAIEAPTDWCRADCAYILLTDAYRADAATATSLGWPVVERPGAHLDIVNDEEDIADILADLADRSH